MLGIRLPPSAPIERRDLGYPARSQRTPPRRDGAPSRGIPGPKVTAQDALTFHRPPRDYPPAVPSERVRIAPPPTEPPPPHTSIIQILFPVIGGVGLLGFALVYGNSAFLIVAGAMIGLLLIFSVGMRWSQKRQVRKRAAEDARRYARYLRERDAELAEAGELQRAALGRL